jgi:hypothetical protein
VVRGAVGPSILSTIESMSVWVVLWLLRRVADATPVPYFTEMVAVMAFVEG